MCKKQRWHVSGTRSDADHFDAAVSARESDGIVLNVGGAEPMTVKCKTVIISAGLKAPDVAGRLEAQMTGAELRAHRKAAGLSQVQLARLSGFSRDAVTY